MEAHDLDVLVLGRVANMRYAVRGADPLERRHPPVRPRLRGRARHPGDLPPQHLGRGRPGGDPARPPLRDHVEPDEPRHGAAGHRGRRRARAASAPTRCRRCSRSCCRWRSPTRRSSTAGPRCERRAASRRRRGRRHPRRHRRRRGGDGRGGGRAAARRERARAHRRVHGRDGVARRHHAGDAGRRPHHLGRSRPHGGAGGRVQAGDLVAFDAGVVADGYAGEVGRTWPVGLDGSAAGVEDLYRRWDELWARLLDACRAGRRRPAGSSTPTGRPASRCRWCRSGAAWASASTTR